MRRLFLPFACAAAGAVAGCGGSATPASHPAALVAGTPVSRAQVTAYVRYADRFYGSVYGPDSQAGCRPSPPAGAAHACETLEKQALSRLIEERIVTAYAARHRIALDTADLASVNQQMKTLQAGDPTTRALLGSKALTVGFLRHLLETEMLVTKVEDRVAGNRAASGYAFHVHMYALPHTSADDARVYRQAERLATDGKPVPDNAVESVRWIAAFRLPTPLAQSLRAASNGDFVGPFRRGSSYLVVRRLRAGTHPLAKPARTEVETRIFRQWLAHQVRKSRPSCFAASGRTIPCPEVA